MRFVRRALITAAAMLVAAGMQMLQGREPPRLPADVGTVGRPVAHRLNRIEYANTIRDLLDLEVDPEALLPPDEWTQGFDNIGGVLSMSPALLERYLSAAHRIARLAVGDPAIGPAFGSHTYEAPQTVFQEGRMSEDFAFGTRGGLGIRHRFPLDGEY